MDSSQLAEWRFTTRSRAGALIGDLLEARPRKGNGWFWFSVLRILVALAWRAPVAVVTAFVGWLLSFALFHMLSRIFSGPHPPVTELGMSLYFLDIAVALLAFVTFYATARFGVADRFTGLSAVLLAPVAAIVLFWWNLAVVVVAAL